MTIFQLVGMHWHLWRIRRRQRALFESGLLLDHATALSQQPTTKKIIDPASLSIFPTRIVGDEPTTTVDLALSRVESNRSIRSTRAIENAELLLSTQQDNLTIPVVSPTTPIPASPAPVVAIETTTTTRGQQENTEEACVICLDEFALGEQVRKLPCGHEYHCECIGKLLLILFLFLSFKC